MQQANMFLFQIGYNNTIIMGYNKNGKQSNNHISQNTRYNPRKMPYCFTNKLLSTQQREAGSLIL